MTNTAEINEVLALPNQKHTAQYPDRVLTYFLEENFQVNLKIFRGSIILLKFCYSFLIIVLH